MHTLKFTNYKIIKLLDLWQKSREISVILISPSLLHSQLVHCIFVSFRLKVNNNTVKVRKETIFIAHQWTPMPPWWFSGCWELSQCITKYPVTLKPYIPSWKEKIHLRKTLTPEVSLQIWIRQSSKSKQSYTRSELKSIRIQ